MARRQTISINQLFATARRRRRIIIIRNGKIIGYTKARR